MLRYLCAASILTLAIGIPLRGQQAGQTITVPLTDPARPATVRVGLVTGGITVQGANRRDVAIEARARSRSDRSRPAGDPASGLRRLSQTPDFEVTEDNNLVTVNPGPPREPVDYTVLVPARSNLKISTTNSGVLTVEGVDGDLELQNTNGDIRVSSVAGSVVAQTVNGKVSVVLTRATPQKPMSFTSLNGNVDVTLPADTKATLKLRSDQGDVYTDFDIDVRPQPSTAAPSGRRDGGRYRIEINKSIYGAINGGGPEFELRTFNGNVYVRKTSR